jgi:LysM repeat protein
MGKILNFRFVKLGSTLIKALLLISFFTGAFAGKNQPIEVQRSTEKVMLEGKVYYIHVVKKGETLYSVAKAYNATQQDIIMVNPAAANGLRDEQILRIPENLALQPATLKKDDGYINHIVEPGQTLYAISKKYNTTIELIEKLNPEVKYDSLQVNQVLKIQANTSNEAPKTTTPPSTPDGYIIHKVEAQETLYALSKKYNVEQDDISKANDGLKDGLKVGMFLRIPKSKISSGVSIPIPKPEAVNTSIVNVSQLPVITSLPKCDTNIIKGSIKVALLLPFFANPETTNASEVNNEENEEKLQKSTDFNPVSVNFIEFYQGVLVSLEQYKTKGISVELQLFDTEKSIEKIQQILQKPFLANCDLIIGPIFPEQVKPVADFALAHNTYMVSPVSHRDDILKANPYYIEINSGADAEYLAMANYICQSGNKDIYLVYPPDPLSVADANKFKAYINSCMQKLPVEKQVVIKDINVLANNYGGILQQLDSLQDNFVVSPIKDEIFANNLIRSLNSFLIFRHITVLGPKEWTKYKSMDLECFYNLEYRYFTPFNVDYTQNNTRQFLQSFRQHFETEPVKLSHYGFNYGMLGFDITNYFIDILSNHGHNFGACINKKNTNLLLGHYNFERDSINSGYENNALQLVGHSRDYRVVVR